MDMGYNESLCLRIRELLAGEPGLVEKKMFGGIGFLLDGNMACGVHKDALIVRVGADAYQSALDQANARPFDMTGRPMTGWVMVDPPGFASESALDAWVRRGWGVFPRLSPQRHDSPPRPRV